jgi:hypothetical protein
MALKLLSIDEYVGELTHIHCAIKGPHRSGKTTVAAAASKVWEPTLIIETDTGGQTSAAHYIPKSAKIAPVKSSDPKDHKEFFELLGEAVLEATTGNYKCVIIDSLSEVASRMADAYADDGKDGVPSQRDWFKLADRIRAFTRRMRDLPCHTVVTLLTKPVSKDDGTTVYDVALPGQLSSEVPSMFNILALMQKRQAAKGIEHYFTTSGQPVYQVGSRLHGLDKEEFVDESKPWAIWEKIDQLQKDLVKSTNGRAR